MEHIGHTLSAVTRQIAQGDTAVRPIHPLIANLTWDYHVYHPELEPVLPALQEFLTAILERDRPRWFSILGPSGVGKTHLLKQAMSTLRVAYSRNLYKIKTMHGWRGPQMAHIIPAEDLQDYRAPRDYGQYDVIYIEDIGAGADADAGAGKVLRSRVAELLQIRSGKWTLMDSNFLREEIETRLDGRIASRLKRDGSVCIELSHDVPDFWG